MKTPALALIVALSPVVGRAAEPGDLVLDTKSFPALGMIHRLDPRFDELVAPGARLEVIALGFDWCEGPAWMPDAADQANGGFLLFSEIPSNSVRRWDEGRGLSVFLKCAGFTGPGYYSKEPGSNGLAVDSNGQLLSCEHGDRRVSVLTKGGGKRTLADNYQGKRFNSPNDVTVAANGDLYFTDPPYGLPLQADDPSRQMDFCGVFRLEAKSRAVTLVTDQMTRPNGIALSPDGRLLYVAQSDSKAALWMSFPVNPDGTTGPGKLFKDVTPMVKTHKGVPDGMKVDARGNLWASGPGGIHVMAPDGTLLGRIETGEATSNCCFGGRDGTSLFITADMYVCRVQTKVRGAGK